MKWLPVLASLMLGLGVFTAAASGTYSQSHNRLIVLGHSLGPVKLNETRTAVQSALGHGRSTQRGIVFYFGGRLRVDYWRHEQLTTRVQGLETKWIGFHTLSGVRVGSSRDALRILHVQCASGQCSRAAGPTPDAPGTVFRMRADKVVQIDIFYA